MQGLKYGTKLLKSEEILDMVDKVWKGKTDTIIISRIWMAHRQVIAEAL